MPSAAIGYGVKINHVFVEGEALESVAAMTMTVMTAGGIYIFRGGGLFAELSIYNIYIIYR